MASEHNAVYEHLHNIPLKNLIVKNKGDAGVIHVKAKDTIEDVVRALATNEIQSVPVFEDDNTCIGMVDMLDIVAHIVNVAPSPAELGEHELKTLEIAGRAMSLVQVKDVINLSARDPFIPVYEDNPVTQAVRLFSSGVHRTPIFNKDQQVTWTISQSSVVKYLSEHLHMGNLKVFGERSIHSLGLGLVSPICVRGSQTVLEAIKTISENNVYAVAVVNDEGRLQGNFSATDLKSLFRERFPSLTKTVRHFLEEHAEGSLNPVVATPETTLLDVTKEMSSSHIHRMWVVDGDYKPTGVISMTDIMKIIVA